MGLQCHRKRSLFESILVCDALNVKITIILKTDSFGEKIKHIWNLGETMIFSFASWFAECKGVVHYLSLSNAPSPIFHILGCGWELHGACNKIKCYLQPCASGKSIRVYVGEYFGNQCRERAHGYFRVGHSRVVYSLVFGLVVHGGMEDVLLTRDWSQFSRQALLSEREGTRGVKIRSVQI